MKKLNLKLKPIRQIDWIEENGLIRLKVIKFRSRLGQWLCRCFKRPNYFFINLDEIGSFIWKKCNGKNTIEEILQELEEKYGKEMMKERLIIFLQMLEKYGYIRYEV